MPFPPVRNEKKREETAHRYFMARSASGYSIPASPMVARSEEVLLPSGDLVTVFKFVHPRAWQQAKDFVGSGFNVYPIKFPGPMPEHDGAVAQVVISTLKLMAKGDAGVRLASKEELSANVSRFDLQTCDAKAARASDDHPFAGKKAPESLRRSSMQRPRSPTPMSEF